MNRSSILALPATKSVTFRTSSGHMYIFSQRRNCLTWLSFSTNLPIQAGRVIRLIGAPKIGEPLKFVYTSINGDSNELFIVTTSPITDIIK